ncbi:MAG: hypothetical protein GXP14_07045 [Gammaproteobacteria bacterium]|nr:hypothetical protein [Gammaproteobacteria bacterium]
MNLYSKVADVLPHEGRMVLLTDIIDWDEACLEAIVEINRNSLFADKNGYVPSWVGLEYMAQAIAALAGIKRRLAGETVKIGLLLGTTKYSANIGCFKAGVCLSIRIKQIYVDDNNLALFDCKIVAEGQVLATAQVKAIEPDNINDIIKA